MENKKDLNIFWRIASSWKFWLPLQILFIALAIFSAREQIHFQKIEGVLGVIFATIYLSIAFAIAGFTKFIYLLDIRPDPPNSFYIILAVTCIYYGGIFLASSQKAKKWKYLKPLIVVLIFWGILNILTFPEVLVALYFD